MKKLICIISITLVSVLCCISLSAASVSPITYPGNDSNPNDYTPPEGCKHYEIPGSGTSGTYTAKFNEMGEPDPKGANTFTVVVGIKNGLEYTQVLSWVSNFPVYAVIVKGGDAFNLYPYPITIRNDTDLVSPNNASGKPANVSHVSVVICPREFPSTTTSSSSTTPSSTTLTAPTSTTSTSITPSSTTPSSTDLTTSITNPQTGYSNYSVNIALLSIVVILIGLSIGAFYSKNIVANKE